ncbi:MAG: hypothetical protein M3362_05945 [Acidobacteriota bacterium]|nr:hypothetical protein [Acidobacteriota bacterium]
MGEKDQIPNIVRTLVGSGFVLEKVTRKPTYIAFDVYRSDEFGVRWRYLFVFTGGGRISSSDVDGLTRIAAHGKASLVIVGSTNSGRTDVPIITLKDFEGRLGGLIPSFLPLQSSYAAQLTTLGLNKLPSGLSGTPDDLFEVYVHSGLQFILQDKVIRYGQDRRGEVVPDGLVLSRNSFHLLYDCKAAKDGYEISRNSIRQFADYVDNFHRRYESYMGRLHAFLVISGKFKSDGTLEGRARELYAECKVPLVFLTATELGKIIALFADRPALRQSVDWPAIFSNVSVSVETVESSIKARERDKVINAPQRKNGRGRGHIR